MAAGKGILALLAASPKGKGGSSGPPAPMGDEGSSGELGSALREMFDALKAGDDEGAALAFKRAKSCCDDEEMGEDEGDDMPLSERGEDMEE